MKKTINIYAKVTIELNQEYEYTLSSGKKINIIVHGGDNAHGLDISVNGVKNNYDDLDGALGDSYISFIKRK